MITKKYDWTRFWVPRGGNMVLEEGGYLRDPQSQYGKLLNSEVMEFSSIDSHSCLVLLGEPGIGKSQALSEALAETRQSSTNPEDLIIFRNLNLYGTDSFLVQDIFESPDFVKWKQGAGNLYLFLDSLDECLLRVDSVANILAQQLQDLPSERINLRIFCRTAIWPKLLEDACTGLWGDDGVGIYELAPLRLIGVESAASSDGLDPVKFVKDIDNRNVAALAARPITLTFLLNTFRRDGGFPQGQVALYKDGCLLLCEEQNQSRLTSGRVGVLTPEQRLVTASRIAACTVFGNRAGIWTASDRGDSPEEFVTVSDLAGGTETADGNEFVVSTTELTEVLDSGLFSSPGQHRMGWAHQTYAEFLAAYYCSLHRMTERQLMGLFVHPGDSEGAIVPQLSQVAAWIVMLVPEMFDRIRSASPEALLRGDMSMFDHQKRKDLVAALFDAFRDGRLMDWFELGLGAQNLWHPQLDEQLRLYLSDSSHPDEIRELAVNIAVGGGLSGVLDELVGIALDTSEPTDLRVHAAIGIGRIGDERARLALKPLALAATGGESIQQLKGAALNAMWPEYIGVNEVLAELEPPRQGVIGLYWIFLASDFAKGLNEEDLPAALEWGALHSKPDEHQDGPYEHAMDEIMAKAWDHLDAPNVADGFASAALARLGKRPKVFNPEYGLGQNENLLEKDVVKRRTFISAIAPLLVNQSSETIKWRLGFRSLLALPDDLVWMAEKLRNTASAESARVWAAFMRLAFQPESSEHFEIVFDAFQFSDAAKMEFERVYAPIELDTPKAEEMRNWHRRQKEWQDDRADKPLLNPPPRQRMDSLLNQFEDGDLSAWWKLNLEMTLELDSTRYGSEFVADLTELPGWSDADNGTRERLIEAAKQYINDEVPGPGDWIGSNSYVRSDLAGYRAFRLMWIVDASWVVELPASRWDRWASIIMACHDLMDHYQSDEGPSRILCLAYKWAPDAVVVTAIKLIDKENLDHGKIFVLDILRKLWDARLASALESKLDDDTLSPEALVLSQLGLGSYIRT